MPEPSPIFLMAMVTMSSSILFGVWQLRSVEKAMAEARRNKQQASANLERYRVR
jgi:hypothetical protein